MTKGESVRGQKEMGIAYKRSPKPRINPESLSTPGRGPTLTPRVQGQHHDFFWSGTPASCCSLTCTQSARDWVQGRNANKSDSRIRECLLLSSWSLAATDTAPAESLTSCHACLQMARHTVPCCSHRDQLFTLIRGPAP